MIAAALAFAIFLASCVGAVGAVRAAKRASELRDKS